MNKHPFAVLITTREKHYHSKKAAWKAVVDGGLEITYDRYRRIENGESWPTHEEMVAISKAIGISVGHWLEGNPDEIDVVYMLSKLSPEAQDAIKAGIVAMVESVRKKTTYAKSGSG